ncbi:MAG: phosphatase PAP2 family protein [Bacteroidia bacterium]|nr:phosphatase PAP2 family protein [Bacteroidia bacterium]MDW8235060.1 phosphatase PAP2 family protein [Bacteroidia bacterium]
MELSRTLSAWDEWLLLKLNLAGHVPWDTLVWYATKGWLWIPLYVWAVGILVRKWGKRVWRPLIAVGLAWGASDLLTGKLLKPWIQRLRPSHEPHLQSQLRLIQEYRGGLYSFPSSHAANSAATFTAYTYYFRHPWVYALGVPWVLLHSYTRIYMGVHYPSDIIAGWAIGYAIGLLVPRLTLATHG